MKENTTQNISLINKLSDLSPQHSRKKGMENVCLSVFMKNGIGKEWWIKNNITEKIVSEEPDFVFKTKSGKNIGLEITNIIVKSSQYHREKYEATSALITIANKVCEYFKKNKGISLSLNIDFWDKRKWCARTYKELLTAAYDPGFRHLEAKNKEIKQKIIDTLSKSEITPAGLVKRRIEVGTQIFNVTATRWNEPYTEVCINNAGMCKEDPIEELQQAINSKNDKHVKYLKKCDECDLLVVSDNGHTGNFAIFTNKTENHRFSSSFRNVYLLDLGFHTQVIKFKIKHF